MEEKIKEIVSIFTKIPADQINDSTLIDRSAVSSSILLHRLYAKLAAEGFALENYWDIKNFGTLKQRLNGNSHLAIENPVQISATENITTYSNSTQSMQPGIGIDVEEITSMPRVDDIREDEFYKMNFASTEIAYCILQNNSYASLAGLFAAKEAIVKANNNFKNRPFNSIIIDHSPKGKPVTNNFQLSISHTNTFAVAVAVAITQDQVTSPQIENISSIQSNLPPKKNSLLLLLCLVTLCIAILSLILVLRK